MLPTTASNAGARLDWLREGGAAPPPRPVTQSAPPHSREYSETREWRFGWGTRRARVVFGQLAPCSLSVASRVGTVGRRLCTDTYTVDWWAA